MPEYLAPGVYVEEVSEGAHPIVPLGISTAAFVGETPDPGVLVNVAWPINNWLEFVRRYVPEGATSTPLSHAVFGYFLNGGSRCYVVNTGKGKPVSGGTRDQQGLQVLERVDEVAIVVCPGYTDPASYEAILSHCENMRYRVAILDLPADVTTIDQLTKVATASDPKKGSSSDQPPAGEAGLRPRDSAYGTAYWPSITVRDPLPPGELVDVAPSGHVAGIWSRTDQLRGVHKAPANEVPRGALNLRYRVTTAEHKILNVAGINIIRFFERDGIKLWGARTLHPDLWRYLNIRRLFIMVEKSIEYSTNWIVFEPNDVVLWGSITRDCTAFLTGLWRTGALVGRRPAEAFFVKCDRETNPPDQVDLGIVTTMIGLAAVKPAEFVVFRISQWDGGTQVQVMGAAA
jgi:phage tail sheath protein FI